MHIHYRPDFQKKLSCASAIKKNLDFHKAQALSLPSASHNLVANFCELF